MPRSTASRPTSAMPRRPVADAAAAYTDAKTKQNICAVAADTAPDCDGVPGDFHHRAEGLALASHSEVQGDRNGALCVGCRTGQGARATVGCPPRVGEPRLLGSSITHKLEACTLTPWSTCSRGSTGTGTVSSFSRRTCSTSATNCRAACRAAFVRTSISCRAGPGRSVSA